jgi:hypothetical protein
MRSHIPASKQTAKDNAPLQRKPDLKVGEQDDVYEREADRTADTIMQGSVRGPGLSLTKVNISPPLQREGGPKKKSEEDKYLEAATKLGEAFLETGPGKEIKQKAEKLGDAFISTLPGKIITGSAITGAVAALAATHSELPIGIPEIPLDMIKPGLKLKLTYEGPVDKPTKVMATFSIPLGAPQKDPKPAKSKSERFRAETARMAREQHEFRESLKTPQQRADDQAMINAWVLSRQSTPGDPLLLGIGGGLPLPLAPYASEFKITGEQPKSADPEKKKKKETAVQRKANNGARQGGTPAIVNEVLESSGQPLEPSAREFMESRFGHDFRQVRVHTDERAARSAGAINASAYTAGNRIVFASGRYSPATQEGRRLLAHELTHVLQQGGPGTTRQTPVLRRKSNSPALALTPAQALKATLRGDDDSVRELTKSPLWGAVKLTPEQAALLLIQLLDGATLDDDEIAGLEVMKKTLAQGILDDSLTSLGRKSYFNQLLDDYHQIEYVWLLELLSVNISKLNVKALFLDAFIAMYWVKENEEKAIVVLLERTVPADQFSLLTAKGRQQKLRDAIDTNILTIRYEDIAGKVNELSQAELAARLKIFFTAVSEDKAATRNRTPEEVNRLLIAATSDLSGELAEYRTRLDKALKSPKPDADAISEINKEFELRLKSLVSDKKVEFGYELKYGVEFNRFLNNARSQSWTPADLKEFDKILGKIPPEILRANPRFQKFRRASDHPSKAGSTGYPGTRINIFGSLSLSTTVHELGHVISYDDGRRMQKEFNKEFKWQILSVADLTRLIPGQEDREKLMDKLDEDREKKRKSKRHRHAYGSHYYRYDRKSNDNSYLRHPKDACFISKYAATGRREDFAEAFETYFLDPVKLFKKCPKKYRFMRQKVFTGYLFGKLSARTLADFDRETADRIKKLGLKGKLLPEFRDRFLAKLRKELEKKLRTTGKSLEKKSLEGEPSDEMKRIPLTGLEAQLSAKPYWKRLTELFKLPKQVVKPWKTVGKEAEKFKADAPKKYSDAADIIGSLLPHEFQQDILTAMRPHAEPAIAGRSVNLKKWSQTLEDLVKKYQRAFKEAKSYLPDYKQLKDTQFEIEFTIGFSDEEKEVAGPTAWKFLKKVPKTHPGRKAFKAYIYKRRYELENELKQLRVKMLQQIKEGTPHKKSRLTTFGSLVKSYEQDIRKYVKKNGLKPKKGKKKSAVQRKAADGGARAVGAPDIVAEVLESNGRALESPVRNSMESSFGHDFSRVRIHTDARAVKSAQAVHAAAYTVGENIVFGAGRYSPYSHGGRRLLAHELTHVIQQQGTERISSGIPASSQNDSAEHEAEKLGEAAVQGDHFLQPIKSRPVTLMRQPNDLQSIPLSEQRAIQFSTMSVTVPSERIDAFFKLMPSGNPGETRSVGATNSFSANVPAALHTGLASVSAWIQGDTNALPLNSVIEVDLDLSNYGGSKSTYRFSYFSHSKGKGKNKITSNIMLIELIGNVISAPAGQTAPAKDFKVGSSSFSLAGKWSDDHYAVLRQALSLLPNKALTDAAGVTFRKIGGTSSSGEAGEYDQTSDTISLYSNAFPASSTRIGQRSSGVRNVLHEVGHALDMRVLEQAWKNFNTAGQSASARRKLLNQRSPSRSRFVRDSSSGNFTVEQDMSDDSGDFRKAAKKDLVRQETGKRVTSSGTTATLKGGITSYSDTDYQELFAEAFALYVSAPETLRQLRPKMYGYFETRYPRAATP